MSEQLTIDGHTAEIVDIPSAGKYAELRYQLNQLRDNKAVLLDVTGNETACIRQMLMRIFGKGYIKTRQTGDGLLIWRADSSNQPEIAQ